MKEHIGCRISGSFAAAVKYHYLYRFFTYFVEVVPERAVFALSQALVFGDNGRGQRQVGSLAGAAHLLKNNAGVQRRAQWGQKPHVDQKGKSLLDFDFQCE